MDNVPKRWIPLPSHVWDALEIYLCETGHLEFAETVAARLIENWIAAEKRRLDEISRTRSPLGYQWKSVFLPNGTMLRISTNGITEFAQVDGEHIIANGRAVSPSQFVNEQSVRRNAWRCIWLRFPKQEHWERAEDCRLRLTRQRSKTEP